MVVLTHWLISSAESGGAVTTMSIVGEQFSKVWRRQRFPHQVAIEIQSVYILLRFFKNIQEDGVLEYLELVSVYLCCGRERICITYVR